MTNTYIIIGLCVIRFQPVDVSIYMRSLGRCIPKASFSPPH